MTGVFFQGRWTKEEKRERQSEREYLWNLGEFHCVVSCVFLFFGSVVVISGVTQLTAASGGAIRAETDPTIATRHVECSL